jgi:hypothetical protein
MIFGINAISAIATSLALWFALAFAIAAYRYRNTRLLVASLSLTTYVVWGISVCFILEGWKDRAFFLVAGVTLIDLLFFRNRPRPVSLRTRDVLLFRAPGLHIHRQ